MILVRKSDDRGQARLGWLDTHYTFSFADYYDPENMGFRTLRVINEDHIEQGKGFGDHPHRDMEIITYLVSGSLQHRDSMGNGSVIRPGDVQRMSAGTGVVHSEFNPSPTEPVHLFQVWLLPEKKGLQPGYEQKNFPPDKKFGRLCLLASRDGREGSVTIHQDANLYVTLLERGQKIEQPIQAGRHAWIQVIRGKIQLNGIRLQAGDGAALSEEAHLSMISQDTISEALVFDLA